MGWTVIRPAGGSPRRPPRTREPIAGRRRPRRPRRATVERPPRRRSRRLRSTTQALEQVANVLDGGWDGVLGLEDEATVALDEPREASGRLDLDASIPDGHLD